VTRLRFDKLRGPIGDNMTVISEMSAPSDGLARIAVVAYFRRWWTMLYRSLRSIGGFG
jgi:hypothetical protein